MQAKRTRRCRPVVRAAAIVLAAAAAVLALDAQASDAARLIGRTWRATSIQGGGVIANVHSTVRFEAAGKVTGSGGCNRLFGAARIAGHSLAFADIATTRKACPPAVMQQEQKFLAALAATRTFRFTGPTLRLYDASGAELVRFAGRR
jgi:heat shock protein HslJ